MKDKHDKPKQEETQPQEDVKAPEEETTKLRQELEALRREKDELLGRLQRVSADYRNYEKRTAKQISDSIVYEKDRIIRSLLPVLDDFELMLKAHSGESTDAMVRGVKIIYGKMLDILRSHGIEQIQALGQKFDPERHQGMTRREEPDKEHDVVLEEFQKGYLSNDRVLRPSRVAVNKCDQTGGQDTAATAPPADQEAEVE